jgi:hypothetical protein
MTPDEQRIAIARACGWTGTEEDYTYYGFTQNIPMTRTRWTNPSGGQTTLTLPDYLNDLNAMHDAEKAKEMAFNSDYAYWLAHVAVRDRGLNEDKLDVGDGYQIALTTTASQRAEAFLRTLGLWQETPTQPQ